MGAEVSIACQAGCTPLWKSVHEGNVEAIHVLVDLDGNVNTEPSQLQPQRQQYFYNTSPLRIAAAQGHVPAIRALVEIGANVNATDSEGLTALHKASQCGHKQAIKVLVDLGTTTDALDSGGLSTLFTAIIFHQTVAVQLLRQLVTGGSPDTTGGSRGDDTVWNIGRCYGTHESAGATPTSLSMPDSHSFHCFDYCFVYCYYNLDSYGYWSDLTCGPAS